MIGYLGEVVFVSSSRQVKTLKTLSTKEDPRVSFHETLGRKPVAEFVGQGTKDVNLTLSWRVEDGVNPEEAMAPLRKARDEGEVLSFFLGNRPVGSGRFLITGLSESLLRIDNQGRPFAIHAEVALKEYVTNKATVKEKKDTVKKREVTKKNVTAVDVKKKTTTAQKTSREKLGAR